MPPSYQRFRARARAAILRATPHRDPLREPGGSCAPDHACDLRLLRLEPCRIAPPRRLTSLGREQAALLGKDHPGKAPPVRHHVAGRLIDEVVPVLERECG